MGVWGGSGDARERDGDGLDVETLEGTVTKRGSGERGG